MPDSRETAPQNAFVVGWPIKHSRSPKIHKFWLKRHGIAGQYEAVAVPEVDFPRFMQSLKDGSSGFCGGNVTIPHKETASRLCTRLDERAEEIGAVNTLWRDEGELWGTNTDCYGFSANLDDRHPGWEHVERAVILGAGGASRAVIQAVRDRGVGEINVVNRTEARGRELAHRFGSRIHAHGLGALDEVMKGAGLFINTSSLGMDGDEVGEFDFSGMTANALVTDIIYVPLETPILRQARAQGRAVVDGLGMLLHQAVPGFEKWFGIRPEVDDHLRGIIVEDLLT